jgi:hypothetical protein
MARNSRRSSLISLGAAILGGAFVSAAGPLVDGIRWIV